MVSDATLIVAKLGCVDIVGVLGDDLPISQREIVPLGVPPSRLRLTVLFDEVS